MHQLLIYHAAPPYCVHVAAGAAVVINAVFQLLLPSMTSCIVFPQQAAGKAL